MVAFTFNKKQEQPLNRVTVKGDWNDADYIYATSTLRDEYLPFYALLTEVFDDDKKDEITDKWSKENGRYLDIRDDLETYLELFIKRHVQDEQLKEKLLERVSTIYDWLSEFLPYNSVDGYGPHRISIEYIVDGVPSDLQHDNTIDELFAEIMKDEL